MSLINVIWFLFILSALQPILLRRLQDMQRKSKMEAFAQSRSSKVIALIHRQETMKILGFPLARYIDMQDSETILREIQKTDDATPIDLILHTPGGLVLASTQIARAIHAHPGKVTVYVPHMAMSGGTLIALSADKVVMCRHSVLGPVDPQINQFPAVSIISAVEAKPVAEVDDETLILADISRKAIAQLEATVAGLLPQTLAADTRKSICTALTSGKWTHDHPIFADEAAALGLPVSTDMPVEILDLMALYPQPTRMAPTVESSPTPTAPAPGRRR